MKVLAFTDVGDGPVSDPLSVMTNQGGIDRLFNLLLTYIYVSFVSI